VSDKTIKIAATSNGKELESLSGHKSFVRDVAFSSQGSMLASASMDGTVKLWDTVRSNCQATLIQRRGAPSHIVLSPDGRLLAVSDIAINMWDTASGKELAELGDINATFSPDSRLLATAGSLDPVIKIYDLPSAKERAVLWGHASTVAHIAFCPDGQRIASVGNDGVIKLWDVTTGKEVATWEGGRYQEDGGDRQAVFSPDGHTLAHRAGDGKVTLLFSKLDRTTLPKRKVLMQEQQADELFRNRQWFAAAFYLRQLLKDRPNDAELQSRLDRALAEMKKQQESQEK
jgi:WD40 repeat protein